MNEGFLHDENLVSWKKEWQGMPEFSSEDLKAYKSCTISFETAEDVRRFTELMKEHNAVRNKIINKSTATIDVSFNQNPKEQRHFSRTRRWASDFKPELQPKYPIYIISKGRWERRYTSRALERMKVPYHIVIEPQEEEQYASVIDPKKILILPFSNLGQGSIPARNWVWEHAKATGAKRHWILDDNIRSFYRYTNNMKIILQHGVCFRVTEDFVDRYTNIALAGLQYQFFAASGQKWNAYNLNTRIYSCILILNELPYRWRGRYNEDTDLSLRVLKDGWCTLLMYAFLCEKMATMKTKGGNTESLYDPIIDGRLKMAQSLIEQHPDVTTIIKRWNRFQHLVDYTPFAKNRLIRDPNVPVSKGVNNYTMRLQDLVEKRTVFTYSKSPELIWVDRDNPIIAYMQNTSRTQLKLAQEFNVTQKDISDWIHNRKVIPETVIEYIRKKENGITT